MVIVRVVAKLDEQDVWVTIQYNTIQYNTIQYNTMQYNTIHTSYYVRVNSSRVHPPRPCGQFFLANTPPLVPSVVVKCPAL